ncbi:hypothetical protein [Candidatus Solincola sp.]|nr:hypothetical protein [Actinomycetota bacterium]MDI7251916.1 hypothetical protein [Actinomycetota bacterium]
MREGALEILALLLLGFIAMLAIVPPIIRGKLEDSPLVTTQTFRKSMQGIAHSLEPRLEPNVALPDYRVGSPPSGRARTAPEAAVGAGLRAGSGTGARISERSASPRGAARIDTRRSSAHKAAVRRNRIFASLTFMALIWGMATLFTGSLWCLVMFSTSGFLLAFYWGLTIVVPYILMRSGEVRRESSAVRGVHRRYIA